MNYFIATFIMLGISLFAVSFGLAFMQICVDIN